MSPLDSYGSQAPASELRELPDRELVVRCQRSENRAFDELIARHQDRVYSAVARFCGNAEDAADIVQRAFINAFRKIQEFKGDSAFSTWIYRIAFNQAISFRRENRRATVSIYSKDDDKVVEPAVEENPTEKIEGEETKRKVQQALDLLDAGDRQIILLKDLQGHSYDEIADIMQIPKGTVRSRLHRARLELKSKLKPYIGTLKEDPTS
ncbi:MAG TPA: sigma-70 family RNA polymerase sigma factor [Planctomycetota bacterium]|nr:sigma-70 family RNA polymerase sigma factor [Planctomycetota bacterium]